MTLGVWNEAKRRHWPEKQDSREFLQQRTADAAQRLAIKKISETAAPCQLFLPGMDEFMRAMPNHIARSSLFAPVAAGRKKIYKDTILVSRGDSTIKFWGEQLDEAQADVWMQAMHQAIKQPLGIPIIIERAAFLRAIGRSDGGANYKWLHSTMQALAFAMLVIEVQNRDGKLKLAIGKSSALHMIEGFDYDDDAKTYTLRIDPRWREMYGNREFAMIDWGKRFRFGQGQNMAKALQRLVATSADQVQRYALDWLKSKLEYEGRLRDFEDALKKAMRELERLEIIASDSGRIKASTKGKLQAVWMKL